jgi:hypothetical protein
MSRLPKGVIVNQELVSIELEGRIVSGTYTVRRGSITVTSEAGVASKLAKPVMFPLGRSSRGTMPLATGSATSANTIGIVRLSRWRATAATVAVVTMMSGCKPTNSCASARIRLVSPPPHRRSIRTLRPSVQPNRASTCVNAETKVFHTRDRFRRPT